MHCGFGCSLLVREFLSRYTRHGLTTMSEVRRVAVSTSLTTWPINATIQSTVMRYACRNEEERRELSVLAAENDISQGAVIAEFVRRIFAIRASRTNTDSPASQQSQHFNGTMRTIDAASR
jgi:hypothetical protein